MKQQLMEHGLGQTFTGEQLLFKKCQSGEKLMSLNTGIKRCATTDGKAFTPFKILVHFQTYLVFPVSTETCFISNPVWLTHTAAAHLLRALPHFVIHAHITLFHLQLTFGNKAPLGKPWVQQAHLRDPVRPLAQAQHQANEPVQPINRHLLKLMQGIWGYMCALAALPPLDTDAHHTHLFCPEVAALLRITSQRPWSALASTPQGLACKNHSCSIQKETVYTRKMQI